MSWLFDLGNTRLKLARLTEGEALSVHALSHAEPDFATRLDALLSRQDDKSVWLASVADTALTHAVIDACLRAGFMVHRVQTQAVALGLQVAYAQPSTLGVDRWLAMLALHLEGQTPCVVCSVGSALTLDVLDGEGRHWGGLIAPTPQAMREALFARAPALVRTDGEAGWLGQNTADCIESGCLLSSTSLIRATCEKAAADMGLPVRLILGGGGAPALSAWLPAHEHRPHLVLDGLAQWVRHTRADA